MWYIQSLLEDRDGSLERALTSVQRSIDLWTQYYGPHYYLLATGYSLHAQLLRKKREVAAAVADFQHSLAILKETGEDNSKVYFLIEGSYANLLYERRSENRPHRAAIAG